MNGALAYIPFLDPINALHDWWYTLIVPLSLGISIIYRALRLERLDRFWSAAAILTVQILVAMGALGIVLVMLVQGIIPLLPAE